MPFDTRMDSRGARRLLVASALLLLAVACQPNGGGPPPEKAYRGEVEMALAQTLAVGEVKLGERVNSGSPKNPIYRSTFTASGAVKEDLYVQQPSLLDVPVLERIATKGQTIAISGEAEARLWGDGWRITITDAVTAPRLSGDPLSRWAEREPVIAGSPQEAALRAERDALDRGALPPPPMPMPPAPAAVAPPAKAPAAASPRLPSTASETLRSNQTRQPSVNASAPPAAASVKAADAESNAAQEEQLRLQRVSALSRIAGAWKALAAITTAEGAPASAGWDCLPSSSIKFDLDVPPAQGDVVEAGFRAYMADAPQQQVAARVPVSMSADARLLTVAVPRGLRIACRLPPRGGFIQGTPVAYESDGRPWTGRATPDGVLTLSHTDSRGRVTRILLKKQ